MIVLFSVGCGTSEQGTREKETAKQSTAEQSTVEETTKETTARRETTESTTPFEFRVGRTPMDEEDDEDSPEDVLALQYEYINRGDYERAYSLFAERSQREVSLARYRKFFEDNAPYSVTDYSFSPAEIEGDSASVDAAFTVTSASGVERLERTQEFVREDGDWRVVMRPEQIAAFTATGDEVETEPESEAEPEAQLEPTPQPKAKSKSQPKAKSPAPPPAPTSTSGSGAPLPGGDCPSEAPIKGNVSSSGELIYHVPGGGYYDVTNAEECFPSESDAQNAGYRASKR